jgi:arabinofuranosyltransferase
MDSSKIYLKNIYYFLPGILFCIYFIMTSSFDNFEGRIFTLSDDVMISMSYAKTLANSGELVWYEGAPRVQGFTNFLYTIALSLLHLFKFNLTTNSLIVSLLNLFTIFIISLKVTSISLIVSNENQKLSYFLGGLIPFQYPLVFWSLRGFEVGVISLIVILVVDLLVKSSLNNSKIPKSTLLKIFTLLCIGILIRIDFIVIFIGVSLYLLIFNTSNLKDFFNLIKLNLSGAATLLVLFLFQYFYYGDPLPNTYYLKTDGFHLIEKIPRGVLSSLNLLPLLIFILYISFNNFKHKERFRFISPIFFVSLLLIIYNIYIGGDAWEVYGFANRFITPVIPLAFASIPFFLDSANYKNNRIINLIFCIFLFASIFLIQMNVSQLLNFEEPNFKFGHNEFIYLVVVIIFLIFTKNKILSTYLIAILFTLFLSSSHIQYMHREEVQITNTDYYNVLIGSRLSEVTEPDARVAIFWAGNLSYYMNRPVIDFLGKSDRFIAKNPPVRKVVSNKYNFSDFMPGHNKWNFEYSIGELQPDIVTRNWPDPEFFNQLELNKYKEYCINVTPSKFGDEFPIYVKNNSKNVIYDKLISCSDKS